MVSAGATSSMKLRKNSSHEQNVRKCTLSYSSTLPHHFRRAACHSFLVLCTTTLFRKASMGPYDALRCIQILKSTVIHHASRPKAHHRLMIHLKRKANLLLNATVSYTNFFWTAMVVAMLWVLWEVNMKVVLVWKQRKICSASFDCS